MVHMACLVPVSCMPGMSRVACLPCLAYLPCVPCPPGLLGQTGGTGRTGANISALFWWLGGARSAHGCPRCTGAADKTISNAPYKRPVSYFEENMTGEIAPAAVCALGLMVFPKSRARSPVAASRKAAIDSPLAIHTVQASHPGGHHAHQSACTTLHWCPHSTSTSSRGAHPALI